MRWFIPFEQLYMYRLKKAPPEMPLNDYILEYKHTGDEMYLAYFLHRYEYSLNIRTEDFCEHYGQLQHFQDVKQTIVTAMFAKIKDYDPEIGATLMQYTDLHIAASVIEYLRQNCGAVAINENAYDDLRQITAIYYDENERPAAMVAQRLQAVKEQTGHSEKKIREFLRYGELFRYSTSLDSIGWVQEDEGRLTLYERIDSHYKSPEYLVLKKLFYEAIIAAVDGLPYQDNHLFVDYLGLKRIGDGFSDGDPLPKMLIAAHLHVGSIEAVNERFKRAVRLVRAGLEEQGWIERRPKGTAE